MAVYKLFYKNLDDLPDKDGFQPIHVIIVRSSDIYQIRSLFYQRYPRSIIIDEEKLA